MLTKEKEPAPAATDASPKGVNVNHLYPNHNTEKLRSQPLSAITMLTMVESMIEAAYGREAEATYIHAGRDSGEYHFVYEGVEYSIAFGTFKAVPEYGGGK